VLLTHEERHILVDASPDLRSQALAFGVGRVDAVLFTHHHADHILGIDDLRIYNYRRDGRLPCYADGRTLERLKTVFDYAFAELETEQSRPMLDFHEVDGVFELFGLKITPFELLHGSLPILGFLFEDGEGRRFGYATDCSGVPERSARLLAGVDLLILDALRYTPHVTHFSLSQALEVVKRLQPRQTLFTHIAHQLDHRTVNESLPPETQLAFDGQIVDVGAFTPAGPRSGTPAARHVAST
jgi:phosphoribosyl 1,2-cyclic phosphate phosphodiesterase